MPRYTDTTPSGEPTWTFSGVTSPNTTQVPDQYLDELLTVLTGAELKVLLYITRRTFGFKKSSDNISLSQMLHGITTKSGDVLDHGTGLSKKTLLTAIKSLTDKNIILTERRQSAEKGFEATAYCLNIAAPTAGVGMPPPLGEKVHQGVGGEIPPSPRGKNSPIQQTVRQQTGNTFRKTERHNLDGMTETPADPSGTAQTVSDPARATTPKPAGEGELRTHPIRAVVESASASEPPTQHSEPPPTRTRVLADPGAKFDPSATPPEREGEGFQRLRDQALKLREEVRREQEEKGSPSAHTPVRLGEVLASHQAATSALTRTDPPPPAPARRGQPPLTREERELRDLYAPFVAHMAGKLHDEAKLSSSLGRFVNAYLAARKLRPELTPEAMFVVGEEALKVTQHHSPTIRSLSSSSMPGTKAKMGYWFALIEVKLGLRSDHRSPTYPPASPRPGA